MAARGTTPFARSRLGETQWTGLAFDSRRYVQTSWSANVKWSGTSPAARWRGWRCGGRQAATPGAGLDPAWRGGWPSL